MTHPTGFRIVPCLLAALLVSALAGPSLPAQTPGAGGENIDPNKVVTAEACGECHVSAFEVWKKTPHATGFKSMHRLESAASISQRMGEKLIKRDSVCLDCHYTPTRRGASERAASGVSCESCHGAGRDWINVHNDYGGKGIDHKSEAPEHRTRRIQESVAAGMRRPSNLYATAASCFRCHTVPNEKLVNVGKHSLGSSGFELVKWSHGEIRHNFLASFLDGDGTQNAVRPPEHDRRLYVTGRALAVEYSLRGLAAASEDGVYAKAMQRRLRSAIVELRAIAQVTGAPEVDEMVETVRAAKPAVGRSQQLIAAADRVGANTRRFLDSHDGTRLAALDPLLVDGAAAVELDEQEDEAEAIAVADGRADGAVDGAVGGTGDGGVAAPTAAGAADSAASAGASAGTATRVVRQAIPAEGEKRSHIRPRSTHATLPVTACQKCHGDENAWWFDDRHFASADPFLDRGVKQVKIARLYGLSPKQMARGDSICMDCHGSFATGRQRNPVQDGVSCQSCHGPAADYLEVHQEGEKSLGRERPGFKKAVQNGMRDFWQREVRLRNCASCHYVTDPRLISSGHPTGVDFDIVEAMEKIRHWQRPADQAAPMQTAWTAILGERGPIPSVRRARLAETETLPAAAGPAATPTNTTATPGGTESPRPRRAQVLTPRPNLERRQAERSADVPPLPEVDDEAPVSEILRLVKEQLERLYRAVGGGS